uniref:Uncharacterized protein n=1 Tax=Romanomermis culicivorax TaxID=13658 RepID=A0A915L6C7_ROMCU
MQIDELDDQQCRHLHRNGGPQKDQKDLIDQLEQRAKGPVASLLTASSGRPIRGSSKINLYNKNNQKTLIRGIEMEY